MKTANDEACSHSRSALTDCKDQLPGLMFPCCYGRAALAMVALVQLRPRFNPRRQRTMTATPAKLPAHRYCSNRGPDGFARRSWCFASLLVLVSTNSSVVKFVAQFRAVPRSAGL